MYMQSILTYPFIRRSFILISAKIFYFQVGTAHNNLRNISHYLPKLPIARVIYLNVVLLVHINVDDNYQFLISQFSETKMNGHRNSFNCN